MGCSPSSQAPTVVPDSTQTTGAGGAEAARRDAAAAGPSSFSSSRQDSGKTLSWHRRSPAESGPSSFSSQQDSKSLSWRRRSRQVAPAKPDYCFDTVCDGVSGRIIACWIPEHKPNKTLRSLPTALRHIQLSLNLDILARPLRLLRLSAVCDWEFILPVYEAVPASQYDEIPYLEASQSTWDATAVLSWRWSNPKPATRDDKVMPMSPDQFGWLKVMAARLAAQGLQYIWIDWCCVPQYSDDASATMAEIMRSRLYYARSRVMLVLPDVHQLQLGPIRLLLLRSAMEELLEASSGEQHHSFTINGGTAPWLLVHQLLDTMIKTNRIARYDYFGRVWTLAERMARCGRGEGLFDWLPLRLWLEMVVDVLLTAAQQAEASHSAAAAAGSELFWSQLFSDAMQQRLGSLLDKLRTAFSRGNLDACPGVSKDLALFLVDAVEAWCVQCSLEEPSVAWLKEYLPLHPHDKGPKALKTYQAWAPADAVWAVYGFFCFHVRSSSPEGLAAACDDLWRHAFEGKTRSDVLREDATSDGVKCVCTLRDHSKGVKCVSFSPDGQSLASGSDDRTIRVWDVESGKCTATLAGHLSFVKSVCFSPDGQRLASGSWDNMVRLWDVASGTCTATLAGHSDNIYSVCFSPCDGQRLASSSGDNTIRLWDVASGACTATLTGHSDNVWTVMFSPDGQRLASSSEDMTIRVWSVAGGECTSTLVGHSGYVTSVCFSPDGKHLASSSADNTIRVWDVASGSCTATLTGHTDWVRSVCFSPDGRRLASGSEDNTICVWDVASGECLVTLAGHTGDVTSVSFSPDGQRLASGSDDNTIRVWSGFQ